MESEFPSNSHNPTKSGRTTKKIEKVVDGPVVQRKKSLGRRFKETFTGDDSRTVGQYILFDVMVPAFKDLILDVVIQGTERKLFGDARAASRRMGLRPGGNIFGNASYRAYNRYTNQAPMRHPQEQTRSVSSLPRAREPHFTYDEIVLATRGEATEVIDALIAIIAQYDVATVSDLFELVGVTGEFTDEKWGWTDLIGADVQRINEGYLLNLPRPQALDR